VLRFKTFGSARAAVRYYAKKGADCAQDEDLVERGDDAARAVDYYGEQGRSLGEWLGSGAGALGLSGPICGGDAQVLERLLSGQLPDGTDVARPVMRPDPAGQLPVAPILAAIQATAADQGVPADLLWRSVDDGDAHARLVARGERKSDATSDARAVVDIATAAGVDPGAVYGPGTVAVAVAKAGEKVDVRRAGADGQLSPPKSVSLLWAFGDEGVRSEVLAAHRAAVGETVRHLERYAGHALRGHQGEGKRAARVGTDGLIVAAFEHLTSRADDPQLHTHLVVANLLHGADGRWSALDTRALFRNQRTAGHLYQAVLRGELTRRLGVGWTPVQRGVAEVAAMSPRLVREFSRRRRQIEARLEATGGSGARAATVACLATRPAKSHRPVSELLAEWRERAAALVGDPALIVRGVVGLARSHRFGEADEEALTRAALGADGVTAHASGFDRGELTRCLLDTLPTGTEVSHEQVEALVDRVLAHPDVLPLIGSGETGERRYTARGLVLVEADALRMARRASSIQRRPVHSKVLAGLSGEQGAMVRRLAVSSRAVDVVLGPAGSGKTAALAAAVEHWQGLGVPVLGAAVAAVAARRLEHATGMPSTSLARLLHRVETRQSLDPGTVVVLDEAGMVGSRDFHRLLRAVVDAGGKLVAVGDRAQLAEIDAGGLFARLAREHLRAELTDNHRQTEPWQRDALVDLRAGNVAEALDAFSNHGHLHAAGGVDEVCASIAHQYVDAYRPDDPFAVVALAGTRRTVTGLNTAIREQLRSQGFLPADDVHMHGDDGLVIASGDLVLITRNDHRRGLLNGTRAQVTAAKPEQLALRLDDGRDVTVPAGWAAERLTHAYAMTVHKAQGLTVDVALVDASTLPDCNAAYVAFSRARHRTEIHVSDQDAFDEALVDDPFARSALAGAGVAGLRERLAAESEQRLAMEQLIRGDDYLQRGQGISR
jgi:conjugative relaxase-like TrwC/TraI family protein